MIYNQSYISFSCMLLVILFFIGCDKEVSVSQPDPPLPTGKIVIDSNPQGAEIIFDNLNTGQLTPDSITHLENGEYDLKLRYHPYLDIETQAVVDSNQTSNIFTDFISDTRNYGSITCYSEPTNAMIYIGDSCINQYTPYTITNLWPATYSITCAYLEHRASKKSITITGGQSRTVNFSLQDTTICVDYNPANSDFPSINTNCLEIDKNNYKWGGIPGVGLVKFNEVTTTLYNMDNSPLPYNYVTCIICDDINRIWIGTFYGLAIIDNDSWTVYTCENSNMENDWINDIVFDHEGNAWIAATNPLPIHPRVLMKFDGISFTSFPSADDKLIFDLAVDNNNNIWAGLNAGFSIFNGTEWITPPDLELIDERLVRSTVESIEVAADGTIWIGTCDQNWPAKIFTSDGINFEPVEIFTERFLTDIYIADNGNIWIPLLGKWGAPDLPDNIPVLIKIDPNNEVTKYTKSSSTLPSGLLLQVRAHPNGDLWFASKNRGIIKFKGANL